MLPAAIPLVTVLDTPASNRARANTVCADSPSRGRSREPASESDVTVVPWLKKVEPAVMASSVSKNSYFSARRMPASPRVWMARLWMTSEWRKRLWGITTAPRTLMTMSRLPSGSDGLTALCTVVAQSVSTSVSS